MKVSYVEVLLTKYPDIEFNAIGEEYEGIEWIRNDQDHPTKTELDALIPIVQKEFDDQNYKKLRKDEYPDFKDYLDGIVKGDQDQIQAYIDACLAVKAKYPKP